MLDVRAPARTRAAGPIAVWSGLVAGAVLWGRLVARHHHLDLAAPPFWSPFRFHPSARLIPALVVAAVVVRFAPSAARTLRWRPLLALTAVASAGWAVAIAFIDSIDGLNAITDPVRFSRNDYLQTARSIQSLRGFLTNFVPTIAHYPQNTKGHPPGMVVIEWLLDKVGLTSAGWNAALVVAGGVAAGVAALVALREIAGEDTARAAAPFMVLVPAVIWWQSADAFFAGVAAWSVTALVLATGRPLSRARLLAVLGGFGFGVTAFLSYGLVLLALVPLVVCFSRRRLSLLGLAALGAVPVFVTFAALGFSWFSGFAATRHAYWTGVAIHRPYSYFFFADIALFAVATGPAVAVALSNLRDRRVWLLVGAALAVVALADLSGMSKAEVERIWLPFVPWVVLATAALSRAAAFGAGATVVDAAGGLHARRSSDDMVAVVIPSAHVLVVEDDPTVREVVVRYLEREGLDVSAVGDGESALVEAAKRWPDLVVLDLMLPALDGFEVCRRLRATAPVPVIMLTARGDEDDRVMGLELGADDYMAKAVLAARADGARARRCCAAPPESSPPSIGRARRDRRRRTLDRRGGARGVPRGVGA